MGIAAYYRGNRAISVGICRDSGCPGCSYCRVPIKPTPRPETWGSKAAKRALDVGLSTLHAAGAYEMEIPTEQRLASVIREKARVGKATALSAAKRALEVYTSAAGV